MTDRERLKKLLEECLYSPEKTCPKYSEESCDGCQYDSEFDDCDRIGRFADYLLANGVTLPPVTVGQKVYETDGVQVHELTVRKVIYDTNGVAFDETAIGSSIFLTPEQAGKKLSKMQAGEKLTYEEFKAELGPAAAEISEYNLLAMYAAYRNDDAEDRE